MRIFWFLLILIFFFSCNATKDPKGLSSEPEVLFTVGDHAVDAAEFIYVYKKNNINNENAFTREDIDHYLDLYINFKLKVAEGFAQGRDTLPGYLAELEGYKEQLQQPYLTASDVTEQLVQEAYDRMREEVHASHILVRVDPMAMPEDTLKAWEKIQEARAAILSGDDFGSVARTYSEDPSAASNGGDLGYYTALRMVYPFENASYNTPVGAVSEPFRTQFGYHIIHVHDRRPTIGKAEAAHIMIRYTPNMTGQDSLNVQKVINDIYAEIQKGGDWDALCSQYSQDTNSKDRGGLLRPFGINMMPREFEEVAFSLDEPEQISKPFATPYGWHIIKLIQKIPLEPLKELEPDIRSKISRDSRSELGEKILLDRLKKENGFKTFPDAEALAFSRASDQLPQGKWDYDPGDAALDQKLIQVGDQKIIIQEFFDFVKKEQRANTRFQPEPYMASLYEKFKRESILAFEAGQLEEKYEDYAMLLREYQEGIILFDLMEEMVWNKAMEDTVGLKDYYHRHRDEHLWKERADAIILSSSEEASLNGFLEKLGADLNGWPNKDSLQSLVKNEFKDQISITSGNFEKGSLPVFNNISWEIGTSRSFLNNHHHFVVIKEILAPAPKSLDEIKGLMITGYQKELEIRWINILKDKFPFNLDQNTLKNVYKQIEKE